MDKNISRHIDRLLLDPNNYRFIDHKDYVPVPDSEIAEKRIQDRTYNFLIGRNEENVLDLIQSFKSNGILKLDPIQVKELNGNYIVIEGNRRTAALKYLYEQFKRNNDVGKLSESDFKSIDLVLISDESPVQHLITMGLHHISGKKKWSPVNQAQLVNYLRFKYHISEEDICNSLAITKHNLRRSLRVLSLIERYKDSDYGDQFQTTMYSIFEEIIKNVKVKNWLQWNDNEMAPDQEANEERLFSWISKEEVIERNEEGDEQTITREPIITKSHEIRELSNFIEDSKAVSQMEESRSISAGFVLSDAVGEARLKNAIDNMSKEVQTAFQFSEFMSEEEFIKAKKLRDKIDKLIPDNSVTIKLAERNPNIYFNTVSTHFQSINIIKYRKLSGVKIDHLRRVNIFAGGNNSGKTSALEIFYLFSRLNNFQSLIDLEKFRGRFSQEFPTSWFDKIFVGEIEVEGIFNQTSCSLEIRKFDTDENFEKSHYLNSIRSEANINGDTLNSVIHLFDNKDPEFYYQTSQFLCPAAFSSPYRYDGNLLKRAHAKSVNEKYFDRILDFLKTNLDPSIEKIEMVELDGESRFMVTSSEINHAIDLTKYGEGLQRVFEITLLIGYCRNGLICIDELDSAIHKTLLIKFTEFIQILAKEFNVQILLSTHSKECIDAFVENDYPDDELTAYALQSENDKIVCKYLEGNKLKQLVESVNIDIR